MLKVRLLVLFLGLSVLLGGMRYLSRGEQGLVFLVHGTALLVVSLIALRWAFRMSDLKWGARLALVGQIFFWSLSEFGWGSHYFLSDSSSRLPIVALTTEFGYTVSFFCGIVAIVLSASLPTVKSWMTLRSVGIALTISAPVGLRLLMSSWIESAASGAELAFHYSELVAILGSFVLLVFAILLLLSTRSEVWSFYACALIALVFGDWGMRVEKLIGNKAQFDIHSVLVMQGIYSAAICLFHLPKKPQIERLDGSSLLTNYRAGALSVIFLPLIVFSLSQLGSLQSLKILSVGSAFGAVLVAMLSFMHVDRVRAYSRNVAALLADNDHPDHELQVPLELRESFRAIEKAAHRMREAEVALEMGRLAAQVAHDIRSPLAALNVIQKDLGAFPEDLRSLLRASIQRINDIANNLLNRNKSIFRVTAEKRESLVYSFVDTLVSEKRVEHRDCEFELTGDKSSLVSFVKMDPSDFTRALSNIVNNAVDAYESSGTIWLRIDSEGEFLRVQVSDRGRGISPGVLPALGQRGMTLGKVGGSGLGIFHAKRFAEKTGGRLEIYSEQGNGTQVIFFLPKCPPPRWFSLEISVSAGVKVVCVDDDRSVHEVWEKRFMPFVESQGLELIHLYDLAEFEKHLSDGPAASENHFYLVDFEFANRRRSGLEVIAAHGLQHCSICVTSYFDDPSVQIRANESQVRLCPKALAAEVPIRIR